MCWIKMRAQVGKAKRNARFQGAGNRFSQKPWCDLKVIQDNFPSYVPYKGITQRPAPDASEFTLLSMEDFIKNHTDNGFLYHGTKDRSNLIAMLRGGLVMSNNKARTIAAYGDGFYTTKEQCTENNYSNGAEGAVLKFEVKNSLDVRVLNCNDSEHRNFYERIQKSLTGANLFMRS